MNSPKIFYSLTVVVLFGFINSAQATVYNFGHIQKEFQADKPTISFKESSATQLAERKIGSPDIYASAQFEKYNFNKLYSDDKIKSNEDHSHKYVPVTSSVPEPETYAMILAGLGLIGFTARRRNREV
jgi:hypothetical protein